MQVKNIVHRVTVVATPVGIGMAGFFIAAGLFAAAFWTMVFVVLCVEGRVRMGYTLPREPNFWAHVALGALLMLLLAALALVALPALVQWAAAALLVVVALSGGRLLVRQLQ